MTSVRNFVMGAGLVAIGGTGVFNADGSLMNMLFGAVLMVFGATLIGAAVSDWCKR